MEKHHPSNNSPDTSYPPGSLPFHPVTFSDQLACFHNPPVDPYHGPSTFNHRGLLFPNHDYQVAYHLMGMYIALLPAFRVSALRSCPPSLLPTLPHHPLPLKHLIVDAAADVDGFHDEDGAEGDAPPASPFSSHAGVRSASSAAIAMSDSESDALFASWALSKVS